MSDRQLMSRQDILDGSLAPSTISVYEAKLRMFHDYVMSLLPGINLPFAASFENFMLLKFRNGASAGDLATIKSALFYYATCYDWPLPNAAVAKRIISCAKRRPIRSSQPTKAFSADHITKFEQMALHSECLTERRASLALALAFHGFMCISEVRNILFCLLYTSPSPRDRG